MTNGVLAREPFGWTNDGNFTSLCPNGSEWVWKGLGECAQDGRDMASVFIGLFSILCFIVSSLPQYYSSCKTGNMDSALSIWFLLLWLGGDSCNLIGSFLADQLPLQKYTAVYYVLADMLMLTMYFYYWTRNRMRDSRRMLHLLGVACLLGFTTNFASFPRSTFQQEALSTGYTGRFLLSTTEIVGDQAFSTKEIIGFSIGSVSSLLYLFSRAPQLYTNYKRKSTEGVSYFLFALVIVGNTTYGLSVLLKNPERGQSEGNYVIHHLPWLIGSLGTLTLDLVITFQFIIYRKASPKTDSHSEEISPLLA